MIKRFSDWRFRNKLLLVAILPAAFSTLPLFLTFYTSLDKVRQQEVLEQTSLLRLDALAREYQSEVREYASLGLEETVEELEEIEEELPEVLETLSRVEDGQRASEAGSAHDALARAVDAMLEQGQRVSRLRARAGAEAGLSESSSTIGSTLIDALEDFEQTEVDLERLIDDQLIASERELAEAFEGFGRTMVIYALSSLGLGLLLALGLARWLAAPLAILGTASRRILDGDYRAVEEIRSREELGELAAGFDRAAEEIRTLLAEKEKALADKERALVELRDNQQRLIQSGKLAAIGTLAAGIAHEINNPLSAVLTYGVLLREKAEKAPPEAFDAIPKMVERLRLIEDAAERCRTIATGLLAFSRNDESEKELVSLGGVIEEGLELLAPTLKRKPIRLETRIGDDLPMILANSNQIQQVLINLVTNAAQAVGQEGVIEISVRAVREAPVSPPEAPGTGRGTTEITHCELIVEDDGPGIDETVLDRIFEPFVTTKSAERGTGLGLSIVHGIVESHGGEILVDSRIGEGTTFGIRLPAVARKDGRNG